jgi:hypothetical protein
VATCESVRHRRPDRARSRERPSIAVEGKATLAPGHLFFLRRGAATRVVVEYGGLDDDDARVPVALAARGSHGKGSRPVLTETFPADPTVHTRATRQEYVNGQLKNKYGDAFVRGNNVLYISAVKDK